MKIRWSIPVVSLFVCLISLTFFSNSVFAAQDLLGKDKEAAPQAEKKKPKQNKTPLGNTITVESPINDVMFGRIKNTALALQNQAHQEDRKAYLILEITPGNSPFHQVQGLAKFLTSSAVSNVQTVAWVPKTVTGNNAALALICKEIILHPDAELGDLGRGKALDQDEQQSLINLVQKRRNPKVNAALLRGLMDPQASVLKIGIEKPNKGVETRVVTPKELQQLQNSGVTISDIETLKEVGVPGVLSGSRARAMGILVSQVANQRADLVSLYNLAPEALREQSILGEAPKVAYIKLNNVIEPFIANFIKRQIERSLAQGVNVIILEIDSPGGELLASVELADAISNLDSDKVLTVAYIPKQALSGAAMIALGCDQIYLQPSALIGDVGVIEMQPGQAFERVPEKVMGPVRAKLSELAKKKSRPTAIAEAMTDRQLSVFEATNKETGQNWFMTQQEIDASGGKWVKGHQIPESGQENNDKLLTLEATRAHELKLAEPTVKNVEELKERLGISPDVKLVPAELTWLDNLIFYLNSDFVHFLLIVMGLVFIYVEVHFVSGLFGILSALCFALFFWSNFLGGSAGWLEIVLFLFGIALLLTEVFVLPGFGIFGITGIILLFSSLIMASVTLNEMTWGDTPSNLTQVSNSIFLLATSLGTVIFLAVLFNIFLPRIPFLKDLVLTPPASADGITQAEDEPHLRPETFQNQGGAGLQTGDFGITSTPLRPSGKIKLGNDILDVVSNGAYIPAGSEVEIIEITGNHIVVRKKKTEA